MTTRNRPLPCVYYDHPEGTWAAVWVEGADTSEAVALLEAAGYVERVEVVEVTEAE